MSTLTFPDLDAVTRLVGHAAAEGTADIPYTKETHDGPALLLVHDQGVYLMSASAVRLRTPDGKGNVITHAKGTNPDTDTDWWDRARELVGGDDFAELLPLTPEIVEAFGTNRVKAFRIKITASTITIEITEKAPKAPKATTPKETPPMTNGSLVTQFKPALLKAMRPKMAEALAALADEYGLDISFAGATYSDTEATFKLVAKVKGSESKEARDFRDRAPYLDGLRADDLGRSFTSGGKAFTITGFRARARKRPIIAEAADGKSYVFAISVVAIHLRLTRNLETGAAV